MIRVAVGVLRDRTGRVLLGQRREGSHLAGLWEFPGGKREPGEGRWDALVRELDEEVGVRAERGHPLIRVVHDYPERRVELDVWEVTAWAGTPYAREDQALEWVGPDALRDRPMPPADRPIVTAIELPPFYLITPEPDLANPAAFLGALERSIGPEVCAVQLRIKASLEGADAREKAGRLIAAAVEVVHRRDAKLLLNAPAHCAAEHAASIDGVHLTSGDLRERRERPAGKLVGASCHSAEELGLAERLGVDFAVLGPVQKTASHPQAVPLGWTHFRSLVAAAKMPVYGLGGLGRRDLARARTHGGQGVAAIRSLWAKLGPARERKG